jgi:hypothetical protein
MVSCLALMPDYLCARESNGAGEKKDKYATGRHAVHLWESGWAAAQSTVSLGDAVP